MRANTDRLVLILRRRAERKSLREIASELGVTRQRVHQLERLARRDLLVVAAARAEVGAHA